ncbi:hypothetical protein K2173_010412 [Erythroxylum novogranatense]|uniref:Uncharacterized protein n=1 Tax=Erythroxylum novogranatense TaxID=1862640 RepID=A0AAV8TDJ7_9ROSI|nr:hypothetical protein K2173_010412 [Erythroxylum novogranatense]
MDAVKLNYLVDVAPKLEGSEGFGEKDSKSSVNTLEPTSWDKTLPSELCPYTRKLPSSPCEELSNKLYCSGATTLWISKPEDVKVQRKAGKLLRSNGVCSKRQRITQSDDDIMPTGADDVKDVNDKLGSFDTKSDFQEKSRLTKQRNNFGNKRVDRRNSKVSTKNKHDFYSVKAGLGSFSASGGGNNIFGLYGLKTDVHDITKFVDDLSLDDLLVGTCKCSSLGKDKGKKAANMTESILQSVRSACSALQVLRPARSQTLMEIDSTCNDKAHTCSSISIMANGDKVSSLQTDLSPSKKDSCFKPGTSINLLDFPFSQPKDTLEKLGLPPPKDLESLLLDAAKPVLMSRSTTDQRQGKQIPRRTFLPPFAWSHILNGQCKTNSDAAKLLSSRSTCHGRWVKIGNIVSSLGNVSESFTKLESLTFCESLVPSFGTKPNMLESCVASSRSVPSLKLCPFSDAGLGTPYAPSLEPSGDMKDQGKAEHCPRLLAAAQTLCDFSTHISRLNQDGMIEWAKKPSQKMVKACKLKSNKKCEDILSATTSLTMSDQVVRSRGLIRRSKLLASEDREDLIKINSVRKGVIDWSAPRSSRSAPMKSSRPVAETRRHTAYTIKQSCMKPPPAKSLNRTCNGQPKFRKLMKVEWYRECNEQG